MPTDQGRWWLSGGVVWADTLGELRPGAPFRPSVVAGDTADYIQQREEKRPLSPAALKSLRKLEAKSEAFLC